MWPFRRRHYGRDLPSAAGKTSPSDSQTSKPVASLLQNTRSLPTFPDGIKVIYDCSDAVVDICFVHGLTGDRERTWTADGQATAWPKNLLPSRLPRARILTFGYDAYIVRPSVASSNRLVNHATDLLADLTADRDSADASRRPLIFVVHSLGGLVCKEAILLSRDHPEPYLRGIFRYLKGIIFMGTPHKGAWMAEWTRIPASALGFVKSTNITLLDILQRDNQLLQSIQLHFLSMVRQLREEGRALELVCFFEQLPVSGFGVIVPQESASLENYLALVCVPLIATSPEDHFCIFANPLNQKWKIYSIHFTRFVAETFAGLCGRCSENNVQELLRFCPGL